MKSCNSQKIVLSKCSADRAMTSWLLRALLVASLAALAACANLGASTAPAQPAPAVVSMEEWMNRGNAALQAGDHAKARAAWRAAAKDYPTAKEPWLRLAEDSFNTEDYGNAVLAAQEALQRDPHDRMAHSVLAVSGLRLTAGSLQALRDEGTYPVGSRDEAVAVTHALRDALGEPVLVPSDQTSAHPRHVVRAARPANHASAPPEGSPLTASASPANATAASGNPLDKLK